MNCFQVYCKRALLVFAAIVFFACPCSGATGLLDQVQIPSSPNPVGSGARALGMGGAFIAIADDATAASWNPGGLIQLELPEISIVGAYFDRSVDTRFSSAPESSGSHSVSETSLNYLSASYPFRAWNRNMIVSLNYQRLYDFNNKWHFPVSFGSADNSFTQTQVVDSVQTGGLSAVGLAYCIQMLPTFSVGFTANIWENHVIGSNHWSQTTNRTVTALFSGQPITGEGISYDAYDFEGINFNMGLMWAINSRWTLGAVFKSPFTADLSHRAFFSERLNFSWAPDESYSNSYAFVRKETLTMPMSYGIGIAYRLSDALTLSADIYRTEWGDFTHKDVFGNKTSAITGEPENEADIGATHQVRVGAEYLIIKPRYVIPVRAGLFYDPAPAPGDPDDFYGVSFGGGIAYKQFIFDVACQYRFGKNVREYVSPSMGPSQDVAEFTVYSSLIIHF